MKICFFIFIFFFCWNFLNISYWMVIRRVGIPVKVIVIQVSWAVWEGRLWWLDWYGYGWGYNVCQCLVIFWCVLFWYVDGWSAWWCLWEHIGWVPKTVVCTKLVIFFSLSLSLTHQKEIQMLKKKSKLQSAHWAQMGRRQELWKTSEPPLKDYDYRPQSHM